LPFSIGFLTYGDLPPNRLVALARLLEQLGYSWLWHADEKFHRDPWVTLPLIAKSTNQLGLGIAVTEPYSRHPALIAMAIATLAELAPNRLILGLGAGGPGFPAMGIDRTHPAQTLRDAIGIIRSMLSGKASNLNSEILTTRNAKLSFESLAEIPIILGTRSKYILQLAGELADGVMTAAFASPQGLNHALDNVNIGEKKRTKAVDFFHKICRVDLCIDDNIANAHEAVKPGIALPLWANFPNFKFLEPLGLLPVPDNLYKVLAMRDYNLMLQKAHLVPDNYIRHMVVAGNQEQVIQQMVQIVQTGVNQITIRPIPSSGSTVESILTQFSTEIIPEVLKQYSA
jgi:5,10-methylenetetrahydromethanopterin reductase